MFIDPATIRRAKLTSRVVRRPGFQREPERAQLAQILDLIFEDNRLNVYAGKLEVRPPGAPTTKSDTAELVSRERLHGMNG